MSQDFFIEIAIDQKCHYEEKICGDVFVSHQVSEENRLIAILADGMGHGVKANILATLTATMAKNFTIEHKDYIKTAEIITKTLPVCKEREVSYSTFTILDVENGKEAQIVEFENPGAIVFHENEILQPEWQAIPLKTGPHTGKNVRHYRFMPQKNDRILFFTDGIVQAGTGGDEFPVGFGMENLHELFLQVIKTNPGISAQKLAEKIVTHVNKIDEYQLKDDVSCVAVYFRDPRRLMLVSGPPADKKKDAEYASLVNNFEGKKIIAGGTTAEMMARELGLIFEENLIFTDNELPPASKLEGFEIVTEGILTLNKVVKLLEKYHPNYEFKNGPADAIVKNFLQSDEIIFHAGTAINAAHQNPDVPIDLELRRTVIHRIARILENKLLKKTEMHFY